MKAPAEVVWRMLVDATNWAKHFPPEDQVEILSGETELALGTKFHRVTVPIENVIALEEPKNQQHRGGTSLAGSFRRQGM